SIPRPGYRSIRRERYTRTTPCRDASGGGRDVPSPGRGVPIHSRKKGRVPMNSPETVFGVSLATYTLVHVLISLVGIASGLVVLFGLVTAKRLEGWTALFLATTVATSVTGFGFPFDHLLPSHKVGILSLA